MTENPTLSIAAGDLRAAFWPYSGLLGVSLSYRGEELLRRVDNLEAAKSKGSTAGIPLLYPWANRLALLHYRAAGRDVNLDAASSLLHFDDKGLPMHGVPWGQLCWKIVDSLPHSFVARLDWDRLELLELFPFPHRVEIAGSITPNSVTLKTRILADSGSPVPVSFGFHPYFGIPRLPRAEWQVQFPAMRKLNLDSRGIPDGATSSVGPFNSTLGEQGFDNGFSLLDDSAAFSLCGAGYKVEVIFLEGFTHAQIFAPKDKDFIALEPMTAPTNALVSGDGLRIVEPGQQFQASFRIAVTPSETPS